MEKNITDFTSVSHGFNHSMGIREDGSLWSWGHNETGQLGLDVISTCETLAQVGTDTDWAQVVCGIHHTVGVKHDGSLWAWGSNDSGQLGLGEVVALKSVPVQVGSDTDWSHVSCGVSHTVALKKDGSLWAWGSNHDGQLGLADLAITYVPTKAHGDDKWLQVNCGKYHTVGLKDDGTVWTWGDNEHGQLGLGDYGTVSNRTVPTQVGNGLDSNWVKIECGHYHTVGLKEDGSLWAWGTGNQGLLGLGISIDSECRPINIA